MFKCACACIRSGSRDLFIFLIFCLVKGLGFMWGGKVEQVPSSPNQSSGKSCQTPDLSCLHSAEDALLAKAPLHTHLSLYSEGRSSLCINHPFWLMLLTLTPHVLLICLSTTSDKEAPTTAPPASLVSAFSSCGESRTASDYALL